MRNLLGSLCVFLIFSVASAQKVPLVDDPELYVGVLHFVVFIDSQAQLQKDPAATQAFSSAIGNKIGISQGDTAVLLAIAKQEEAKFGTNQAIQGIPRTNEAKRVIQLLAKNMSPAGWLALHAYVNGEYRNNTSYVEIQK